MLSIRQLSKSYHQPEGEVLVLDNIDFQMQTGTSVALLGESGSGKSTIADNLFERFKDHGDGGYTHYEADLFFMRGGGEGDYRFDDIG